MRRLISVILSVVMALSFVSGISFGEAGSAIAITASAAENTPLYKQMLPYHYSKLSDTGKSIYIELRKAAINHESKLEVKKKLDQELIEKLMDIIFYEDALAFNVKSVSYKTNSRKTEFDFSFAFKKDSSDKMLKKMNSAAKKVTSKFTKKTSTYNKILYIHDYIIDHTVYDESLNSAHSAYGSMISGKAVCEGYARAFGYICAKAGIRTVNVVGTATDEKGHTENHMWNKVYYNKKWYDIDLTWDDPVSNLVDNKSYTYFMSGSAAFERSHKPSGTSLTYPKSTADTKMSYYAKKKLVANDNSSAYSLLVNEIAKAAKKGRSIATIKLSDSDSFNSFKNYLEANYMEKIFSAVSDADKKTKVKIATGYVYGYLADSTSLTVSIGFMMKNTSIYDYYTDLPDFSDDELAFYKEAGISMKKSSKAA